MQMLLYFFNRRHKLEQEQRRSCNGKGVCDLLIFHVINICTDRVIF